MSTTGDMRELELEFNSLFGNSMPDFTGLPALVQADEDESSGARTAEVTAEVTVLKPIEKTVADIDNNITRTHRTARKKAATNPTERLVYMHSMWTDCMIDPKFENTDEFLQRLETRSRKWLKEKAARITAVHTPTKDFFTPKRVYQIMGQSATELAACVLPDTSREELYHNAENARLDIFEEDDDLHQALLQYTVRHLAEPDKYRQGLEDEKETIIESKSYLKHGSINRRLDDIDTKLAAIAEVAEGATARPLPAVANARVPVPAQCSTTQSITGVRGLDRLARGHTKAIPSAILQKPMVTESGAEPLVFSFAHAEGGQAAVAECLFAEEAPAGEQDLAVMHTLLQKSIRAERAYNATRPQGIMRGHLLLAEAPSPYVQGGTPQDVGTPPKWASDAASVPISSRDSLIQFDAGHLYLLQRGCCYCYRVEEVKRAVANRPAPLWCIQGLPAAVALEVYRGHVALSTVGGTLIMLRVQDATCTAAAVRIPLLSTFAWGATAAEVPSLWFGQVNGYIREIRPTLSPAGPTSLAWGHAFWASAVSPIRKLVVREQHVLALTEFLVYSESFPNAFGKGFPAGWFLLHGIADVSFVNSVAVAQRVDGAVYMLDLMTRKMDTVMPQLQTALAKTGKAALQGHPRNIYFDGEFLRIITPYFITLQTAIQRSRAPGLETEDNK